jgi:hypothetical protein
LETGQLTVQGCTIGLANCEPKEFLLPAWNEDDGAWGQKRGSLREEREKIKIVKSHENRKSKDEPQTKKDPGGAEGKWLECRVVEALPMLRIKETTLVHDALMLYDGER